ncbi:MAG TPA: amidohydrolase family protein [Xanthobacteraceae bacterium]|jgi:aminocarboxymuconate-semialdehyde decarboxylase|nr:amidohydrolase family protein [Xanthobacteraceae bacterium]
MRIDAFNHFFPQKYFDKLVASGLPDIGKRVSAIPALHDIELRRRIIGSFPDYAQVISLAAPPLELLAKKNPAAAVEFARIGNDGLAELCAKYPDEFPGFVAQAPISAEDAGVAESERAINELGALGVQIFTNVAGKPLDRPEFEPFFAAMNRIGKPIWIHPARGADHPDYVDEKKSLYEIWWTFGWSYETAVAMSRLVFSKTLDRYPDLKIIVHHFGGIVPMLEGRVGPGWDQLGSRTSDEDYVSLRKSMKKRPLDYFKQDFYADTAVFGADAATVCGLAFFPIDKVVFASDCPFDPEKGPGYIRETLRILDSLDLSKADRAKIDHGNLERLVGRKLGK